MEISASHKNIPPDWIDAEVQNQNRLSDSEETIVFEQDDDSKIKPEIELKEETDNFIYKTDVRGHLQLVSLGHDVPNQYANHSDASYKTNGDVSSIKCNEDRTQRIEIDEGYQLSGPNEQWLSTKPTIHSTEDGQQVLSWQEEPKDSSSQHIYGQLKTISDVSVEEKYLVKEEQSENNLQDCTYVHTLPEIYDYSSDSTWEPQSEISNQLSNSFNLNGNMILLTQAEKKRLYRLRIKEENPAMWLTIKKKEAARKREQREKRRHIILEMQKAMESSDLPDSHEVVNQKLYLEVLKERYPELWSQLLDALPATQSRNDQLYNERNSKSKRHLPKPAKMYKDVIEAQKKRLYRQRLKEERPEMYERQKARDAYARSIQRLMSKKKQAPVKNKYNSECLEQSDVEKKLAYCQNAQIEENMIINAKSVPAHLTSPINHQNNNVDVVNSSGAEASLHCVTEVFSHIPNTRTLPPTSVNTRTESEPSQICDNNHSQDNYNHSKNSSIPVDINISNQDKSKESQEAISTTDNSRNTSSAANYTQSNILWYWHDVKNTQYSENVPVGPHIPYAPWRKGPHLLTEEERLQKILKERMHLKEKRKRSRMSMTPEKRMEFLEIERERLKAYRLKKKTAETSAVNTVPNKIIYVDH